MSSTVFGNIFVHSGIFSYVITLITLSLVASIVLQIVRRERADYAPLMWGLVIALFLAGIAGTVMGQYQFFRALQRMDEAQVPRLLLKGWSVALGPMVMATPLAMLGAVAVGLTSYRARRARQG